MPLIHENPILKVDKGLNRVTAKNLRIYAGLGSVAILFALTNLYLGKAEFGGYDLSVLIDSGWRIMNSQIPSQDFVSTLPPSLYLAADMAFRLLGVRWSSILLAESLLYLLLCVLGLRVCWLLHSRFQQGQAIYISWIYVAAQSMLLVSVNHLWHSTMASAFSAYAILSTYVWLQCSGDNSRTEINFHLAVGFAALLLCKPNTAWIALLVCILALSRERRLWIPTLQVLAVAIISAILFLRAFHISPHDAFSGYFGLSGRALPRLFMVGIYPERNRTGAITVAITYLLLLPTVLHLFHVVRFDRYRKWLSPEYLLCFGACLVTLIGLGTNWDLKIVDIAPLLVGIAILAFKGDGQHMRLRSSLLWSTGLLLLFALTLGLGRVRMKEVGPWAGPAFGQSVTIHDRFYGDFQTRQSFAELLREVDLVTVKSRSNRIFFGPRMEFLYAREGLRSPSHLPIWWHPGSSYAISSESEIEKSWEKDHFDTLIFKKGDRTRLPPKLLDDIRIEYVLDSRFDSLDVFYRK